MTQTQNFVSRLEAVARSLAQRTALLWDGGALTWEELEKARKAAKAAWDTWLQRTGPDGKRGMDLALKALGR